MKITANTKKLAQTLAEVVPFAPSKPVVRILKFAKITTKGNRMKIEANNQEAGIVKYVDLIDCDQDGAFLIDIAEFSKFVSKINSDNVEIDVDGEDVTVRHSKGKASFVTQDPSEYPSFTMNNDESVEFAIPASVLGSAIEKGKGFVSSDMTRPQMSAILAYIKDGKFGFCATDTHKLTHGKIATDISGNVEWLIMPAAFGALLKGCAESEDVVVKTNQKKTLYRFGNTHIVTSQATGKYPNFERVIPKEYTIECEVGKDDVLDALKRITLFLDNTGCIKADFSRMDMNLSVDNIDYAKKSVENITHSGCNGEIAIGVSALNLTACIGAFRQDDIIIRMTDSSRPIVFVHKDNPDFITLTMPMQLVGN